MLCSGFFISQELEDFAAKKIGRQNFHQLAMGSGQAEAAIELLENAAREGTEFVCICLSRLIDARIKFI